MGIGRIFEHPAQLLIVLLIILLLFGASRLPNTARQLGRSMRIFKSEMKEMKEEGKSDKAEKPADTADDLPVIQEHAAPRVGEPGRVVDSDRDR